MARTVISYKWGYSCKSHTLTIMLEIHGVYCSDGRSTIMQKIIVYVAILPDGRVVLLHRYAVNIILILALMMLHTNAMSQYNRVHIGVMCVNLHSNLFSFWFCFFFFCTDKVTFVKFPVSLAVPGDIYRPLHGAVWLSFSNTHTLSSLQEADEMLLPKARTCTLVASSCFFFLSSARLLDWKHKNWY